MPAFALLLLVALVLPGSRAAAEELVLGFDALGGWDDNVLFSASDEEEDFFLRAGPSLELRRSRGDLRYGVRYQPMGEGFLDLDGLTAFDHLVRVDAVWQPNEITQVILREDFARLRSLSRRLEALDPARAEDPDFSPDVELGRIRTLRNALDLEGVRRLGPRWTARAAFSNEVLEFSDPDQFDSVSLAGDAALAYALSPRDTLGAGLGVIHHEFDDTELQDGGRTRYYRAFGTWAHEFSPTLSLSLQAGPTWVDADAGSTATLLLDQPQVPFVESAGEVFVRDLASCPRLSDGTPFLGAVGGPGSCRFLEPLSAADTNAVRNARTDLALQGARPAGPDGTLTFFGEGTLTKRWTDLNASLTYRRTAGTVSGSNASTDLDAVIGRLVWTPSQLWTLSLVGSWDRRQSSSEQTFTVITLAPADPPLDPSVAQAVALRAITLDDALDLSQLRFEGRVSRRVSKRTTVFGIVTWQQQRVRGELSGSGFDTERLRLLVGFRWELDPIHL